jgi:hypothetical protein
MDHVASFPLPPSCFNDMDNMTEPERPQSFARGGAVDNQTRVYRSLSMPTCHNSNPLKPHRPHNSSTTGSKSCSSITTYGINLFSIYIHKLSANRKIMEDYDSPASYEHGPRATSETRFLTFTSHHEQGCTQVAVLSRIKVPFFLNWIVHRKQPCRTHFRNTR